MHRISSWHREGIPGSGSTLFREGTAREQILYWLGDGTQWQQFPSWPNNGYPLGSGRGPQGAYILLA